MPTYHYKNEILEQLARHGFTPGPATAPEMLRVALRDLYKYEIRRLRGDLLAGRIAKTTYAPLVDQLRRRYWLLSLPMPLWLDERA